MITFNGRLNTPSYEALSTDLIAGILPGVINPGLTIYFSDTHTWKIVVDGTGLLADYSLPVSVTATITAGDASAANQTAVQVAIASPTVAPGSLHPEPPRDPLRQPPAARPRPRALRELPARNPAIPPVRRV